MLPACSLLCMCAHLHTFPCSRQARATGPAATCHFLCPARLLQPSFLQLCLSPKYQQLAAVLCFSILGVSGRQRRRTHICELDVPWMFNQERQDCRGAQGRIGRCGLPRPLLVLLFPAELHQLLLPTLPPTWVLDLTGGSESGQSPDTCCQQAATHFLCSTSVSRADASKGQLCPEGPEACRAVRGTRPMSSGGSLHHIPCTLWHPACSAPPDRPAAL